MQRSLMVAYLNSMCQLNNNQYEFLKFFFAFINTVPSPIVLNTY
jgi:hypothetical protein